MKYFYTFVISFLFLQSFSQNAVKFDDSTLEYAIKNELSINVGDSVYPSEMLLLTKLEISGQDINSIKGLEYATNLTSLFINRLYTTDLSYLENLNVLQYLHLGKNTGEGNVTDFSSLADKTALKHLALENLFNQNNVNTGFISNLSGLDYLSLSANNISDISFLASMTNLDTLDLSVNDLDKDDLPNLYNLVNLKPPIDLRSNGSGFPDASMSTLASKLPNILYVNPNTTFTWNSHIFYYSSDVYIELDSDIRIKAEYVDTIEPGHYNLSGNISIEKDVSTNDWVRYIYISGGSVNFDKRATIANPKFTGSGTMTAFGYEISTGSFDYEYTGSSFNSAEAFGISDKLYGFALESSGFGFSTSGTESHYVNQQIVLQDLPFPLDKIFDYMVERDGSSTAISGVRKLHYDTHSGSKGKSYTYSIYCAGANFGTFKITELTMQYDRVEEKIGGKFTLKIPGYSSGDIISKSDNLITNIPIEVQASDGTIIGETNLNNLVDASKAYGLEFLEFGMEMQFVEGGLDKIVIALTTSIPIGATGLVISQMTGGVEDLSTDNFKIMASVDIETGLSVPVLGSPVKINDFGVKIAPTTKFEGSGELEVFGSKTADSKISYDAEKAMLELSGNVNIADVLIGKMNASLKSGSFTGKIYGNMQTPSDLPWGFGWAANRKLSAVEAQINDKTIQAQGRVWKLTLAQKMEFGKETFPYFHYYIGRNYNSMYNIFKGSKSSNLTISGNVGHAIIIAGNDKNLFDYTLTSPSGVVFNSLNTEYEKFEESNQTVMIIENPEHGIYQFNTSQEGDIRIEVKGLNPPPSVEFIYPVEKNTLQDSIVFSYYDYRDTVEIEVYIDDDQEGFDGSYLRSYGLYEYLTEGTARLTWNKKLIGSGWREVPNGEYFVYVKIDDENNAPVYQYAPGSFLVKNFDFDSIPKNLQATQLYDSVRVEWDELTDTSFLTSVHFVNVSSGEDITVSVADSSHLYMKNLEYGQEYEIYAKYHDPIYSYEGFKSNSVTLVFADSLNNNPPYFGKNDTTWFFIEDEMITYDIEANDIDGDDLTYAVLSGPEGVSASSGVLSWNPSSDQQGIYELQLQVTDGTDNDTLVKNIEAYTAEQLAIKVGFVVSAINNGINSQLYLYNFWSDNISENINLKNKRTQENIDITCKRITNYAFSAQVNIGSSDESVLQVQEGDTIEVLYTYGGKEYMGIGIYEATINSSTGFFNPVESEKMFTIYPNPNTGEFSLGLRAEIQSNFTLRVYDLSGKTIYEKDLSGNKLEQVQLNHIQQGIYLVTLSNSEGIIQTEKLTIY